MTISCPTTSSSLRTPSLKVSEKPSLSRLTLKNPQTISINPSIHVLLHLTTGYTPTPGANLMRWILPFRTCVKVKRWKTPITTLCHTQNQRMWIYSSSELCKWCIKISLCCYTSIFPHECLIPDDIFHIYNKYCVFTGCCRKEKAKAHLAPRASRHRPSPLAFI